jgi:hypothetical protein
MIENISDREIAQAKDVLHYFVVSELTKESALEAGIFAILNQASRWERPSAIIYKLREASHPGDKNARNKFSTLDVLADKDKVQQIAKNNGWRFYHERRLDPIIEHFSGLNHDWWVNTANADSKYRDGIVKSIKYLNLKTFSFWHLCIGGTNLLPIDIHVRRQLKELGLKIDGKYIEYRARPGDGQFVVDEPSPTLYKKIEEMALGLFGEDERFLKEGKVDLGLVASVLWWRGANRGGQYQANLFNDCVGSAWQLPYGKGNSHS